MLGPHSAARTTPSEVAGTLTDLEVVRHVGQAHHHRRGSVREFRVQHRPRPGRRERRRQGGPPRDQEGGHRGLPEHRALPIGLVRPAHAGHEAQGRGHHRRPQRPRREVQGVREPDAGGRPRGRLRPRARAHHPRVGARGQGVPARLRVPRGHRAGARPRLRLGLELTRNLPKEGCDDWTTEDPKGQLQAAKDKNKDTGGIYVPAARVVKAWNQRYPTAKPLRSYHAEAILCHALTGKTTLDEAVLAFFDKAYELLAPGARTLVPGSYTRYVDDWLSDEDRAKACEKVEAAREKAHEAAEKDDPGEAMDAWVKVFGTSFPAPSTDPDVLAEGLREGTAKAVGAGFAVGGLGERKSIEG